MDEQEEVHQNNMISNLPLLFANGYPTSLDKITESQLETFIPFMVQCSLGHINLQAKIDTSEPEWWPENLPFTIPFSKPKKFVGNWMEKMKEVVIICYQFHKSVFLLRFCNDLASYEHASLRFINNYNSTTSLFDRRSNKLLVTFRNENMSYDQSQRGRKCLLQQKLKTGHQSNHESEQMMVEPAPFDIYLCDNCDAELYSKEAILEHEKTCNVDDDDVILCDTPEPPDVQQQFHPQSNTESNELRNMFLANFNLQYRDDIKTKFIKGDAVGSPLSSVSLNEESSSTMANKRKRMPRRNRSVHSLTRCPTIPLSSPAGQLLLRTSKTMISPEYLVERLDRVERFCHAPPLSKPTIRPKFLDKKYNPNNLHCTFKKPQDYSSHVFVFPRRQFSQKCRTQNINFLNSTLLKRCRPISVRVKKITYFDLKVKKSTANAKLNIKLTRDTKRSSNWKISPPSKEIIVDTIDLCSSEDDEESVNTPKAVVIETETTDRLSITKDKCTSSKSDFPRARLKQSSNKHEASAPLIPLNKTLSNNNLKVDKRKIRSALSKVVSSTNDSALGNKNSNHHYDSNILLSSSATVPTENSVVLPKPVRPYYILSNCTSNPLSAIVTNTNEAINNTPFKSHKHENQSQLNALSNKRSSISGLSIGSSSDWFTESSTFNSRALNNKNRDHQNLSIDRERTTRSLNLVQPFNSPGRIVSIDLTS